MADQAWLLDTSILVDLFRGFAPAETWISSLPAADRRISVITAAELLAGCRSLREQRIVDRELALYHLVMLDAEISQQALALHRRHRLGHGIGFLDCLIAATALAHGLRLATSNLRHFQPITGLESARPY